MKTQLRAFAELRLEEDSVTGASTKRRRASHSPRDCRRHRALLAGDHWVCLFFPPSIFLTFLFSRLFLHLKIISLVQWTLTDAPVIYLFFLNPRSSLEFSLFLGTTNFLKHQPYLHPCLWNIKLFACEST